MKIKIVFFTLTLLMVGVSAKIDAKNLRCLVCRQTFEELNKAILSVEKWKKVDVGNFRMDADGNTMQDKVPAHRSAVYISEVIDEICKKMDDYVRVHYKSTGKLAIMLLVTREGHMNPEFSKTKFVTDDDLNKSLEYYCERMFEDNEDEITELYKTRPDDDIMPDAEREICFNAAQYCEEWMLPNATDTTWTAEMEDAYTKIHGPDPYGFGMNTQTRPEVTDSEGYDDSDEDEDVEELNAEDEGKPDEGKLDEGKSNEGKVDEGKQEEVVVQSNDEL
ncbi:protein seele [Bicyclus anynana]|uniref:Protein seele n=1 Tax=Bicyclus anynana TaxID=110368 RepID=A0ABM3LVG0_BICAN|nr:protein seele [Bicyclus anynana]